jgi:hypothetical protein
MVNTKKLPDVLIWFFIGIVVFSWPIPLKVSAEAFPVMHWVLPEPS